MQARQIYCYAKAAQIGWYPEGRAIALRGLDYLLAKAKGPDGKPGFVHTLKPDGSVQDPLRDSYDTAEKTAIALQPELKVIEDGAEALGTTIDGKLVGTFGHVGTFSFFDNKTTTTGEGGTVTTNDPPSPPG